MSGNQRFMQPSLNRKQFIRASGGALAAASLFGAGGGRYIAARQSDGVTIPDTEAELPTDNVTFRIVTNPEAAPYWNSFSGAYKEKYSNIDVQIDALNVVEIENTLSLGLRNESVHDVFYYNIGVSMPQAVREGWLTPLNDVIPNFDDWFAGFPENTFREGVHMLDGKLYVLTACSPGRAHNLLLFNRQLMEEAGYDPSTEALSVDEYRDAARKITEQGGGQVYGVIVELQPNRLADWVTDLAHRAGRVSVGGIDPGTAEYVYTSDEYLAAIDVLLALKSDGSLFPESPPTAQQAWARVPAGNAAMVTAGSWVVDTYNRDAPDFDFGVGTHPVMDKANALPQAYSGSLLVEPYSVYSGSPFQEIAGDVLSILGSPEGQAAWGSTTGGIGLPPVLPEAQELVREQTNEPGQRTLDIASEMVVAPSPVVRNLDVAMVQEEMQALSPNLGETIQAIFVGETTDVQAAMQDLKDRSEQELDRAIGVARERGAEVSRDNWVFSNWDPSRDYTQDDYDEL